MNRFLQIIALGTGLLVGAGGCSKAPPVPDPSTVPVAQKVDSIQKDPSLTAEQKQQKIQALQAGK